MNDAVLSYTPKHLFAFICTGMLFPLNVCCREWSWPKIFAKWKIKFSLDTLIFRDELSLNFYFCWIISLHMLNYLQKTCIFLGLFLKSKIEKVHSHWEKQRELINENVIKTRRTTSRTIFSQLFIQIDFSFLKS